MKAMIFLVALIFPLITAKCQDILKDQLRWNSGSTTDLHTDESRTYACAFISRPGEIQWFQKGGQSVKTYRIRQQEGSWSDVSGNGSIVFNVTDGSATGTITFQRSGSVISVTMDFSALGTTAIKRRFDITEIKPAN